MRALSLFRALKENLFVWVLLGGLYALMASLLLSSFGQFSRLGLLLFLGIFALSLLPESIHKPQALASRIGLPSFFGTLSGTGHSIFGSFFRIYFLHQVRRLPTVLTLAATLLLLVCFRHEHLWVRVLIAQLPLQNALWTLKDWKNLSLWIHPVRGASFIVLSLIATQVLFGVMFAPFFGRFFYVPLTAVFVGSLLALEGDSGRPVLSHAVSLVASVGTGLWVSESPWALLLIGYFSVQYIAVISRRLHSVEYNDEDSLLS